MTIGTRKASARRGVLAAAVAIAVFAAASASFGQAGGRDYTVTMSNMDYGAIPANLKVGDTIVWMNHDTVQHSVTAMVILMASSVVDYPLRTPLLSALFAIGIVEMARSARRSSGSGPEAVAASLAQLRRAAP